MSMHEIPSRSLSDSTFIGHIHNCFENGKVKVIGRNNHGHTMHALDSTASEHHESVRSGKKSLFEPHFSEFSHNEAVLFSKLGRRISFDRLTRISMK